MDDLTSINEDLRNFGVIFSILQERHCFFFFGFLESVEWRLSGLWTEAQAH